MSKQLNILVLCGGQSAEHEISILSCRNVLSGLDQTQYQPRVVYINQRGVWYLLDQATDLLDEEPQQLLAQSKAKPVVIIPGELDHPLALRDDVQQRVKVDCVFPVLHGTNGEDGTLQGMLDLLNVPYVGCGLLGSVLTMEKHISKRLMRFADLPTADWLTLRDDTTIPSYEELAENLGNTLIVKPVGLGSSVGTHKVNNAEELTAAIEDAFRYDDQVLIESFIVGREIECSVLGNEEPVASLPGEVVLDKSRYDIYSYEAKYNDPNAIRLVTPADLDDMTVKRLQTFSVQAYQALHCKGMARVDFLVTAQNEIFINELNPIPGFTNGSLYPKNWEVSGIDLGELLGDLIQLALADYRRRNTYSHVRLESDEPTVSSATVSKEQSPRS